jgi:hypothetical protein
MNAKWLKCKINNKWLWLKKVLLPKKKIAAIELEGTYAETFAQERQALYTNTMQNLVHDAAPWVRTLNAAVRPIVAFTFVGLLVFVDVAGFIWAIHSSGFSRESMDVVFSTDEMSYCGFYYRILLWC